VPGIKVYGGSIDNVKGCTNAVENGDKVHLGADINVLALHTPWYGNSTCQLRFLLSPFPFPFPKRSGFVISYNKLGSFQMK
jgi:hypothetical protein